MPKNNKKGKQGRAKAATAEIDVDFDDMLAELRATDLTAVPASSNSSSSIINTSATITNVASMARSTRNVIEIPEARIIEAIQRGNIGQLRRWARQGLRVSSGLPLLHAAGLGKLDMVQCLVTELGATVDQTVSMVKERGATGEKRVTMGWTALHEAACAGQIAVVRCLVVEFGADVNKGDDEGDTPLKVATMRGNLAMVRCLVKDLRAEVNDTDNEGHTPLSIAAQRAHLAIVRVLVIELQADVNKADQVGCTPLWIAAQEGNLAVVQCLVKELGADIEQADQYGGTPLMIASALTHTGVVKWLVKAGANIRAFIANEGSNGTAATISKQFGASPEQTAYLEAKTHCSHPGCSGTGLLKCTGCRQARYCGKVCQLAHWKAHKADCRR
jgi:ankyrin repeat protein